MPPLTFLLNVRRRTRWTRSAIGLLVTLTTLVWCLSISASGFAEGGTSIASAPALAYAAAEPSVLLSIPASVSTGTPATVTWKVAGRPAGARVALQRAMGSRHVFRTLKMLGSSMGSSTLPSYGLGSYTFRVIVIGSRGRLLAQSVTRTLRVYGTVPLAALCPALTFDEDFNFGCSTGVVQASGHVFEYVAKVAMDNEGHQTVALTSPQTTCRSIGLQFVGGVGGESYVKSYTVALVQTSLDATQVTGTPGELEQMTANLDGGPWQLNTQANRPYGAGSLTLFFNGTASCYSANGI
ncbi:MAG TPA: hypothetical protein VG147_16565 [Solirubrobacteraceae bacterium]|jgi:hypothetical protein|nr:hypothetical protein [Solirubrobacteraceae bacterium]